MRLYYNASAMFALQEYTPEGKDLFDTIVSVDAPGFHALCRTAHILAEQGELMRRYLGYDRERILSEGEINLLMTPADYLGLRTAVVQAINAGYASDRKSEEDQDVDIGLLELEKKDARQSQSVYLRIAVLCGIPPKDAMLLLHPGQVYDQFDLYLTNHGRK